MVVWKQAASPRRRTDGSKTVRGVREGDPHPAGRAEAQPPLLSLAFVKE